jgi:hypothetical protein
MRRGQWLSWTIVGCRAVADIQVLKDVVIQLAAGSQRNPQSAYRKECEAMASVELGPAPSGPADLFFANLRLVM